MEEKIKEKIWIGLKNFTDAWKLIIQAVDFFFFLFIAGIEHLWCQFKDFRKLQNGLSVIFTRVI
jgi:hypothetical protein